MSGLSLAQVINIVKQCSVPSETVEYLEQLQAIFNEMEVMEEWEHDVWIKVSKATLFGENME